MKHFHEVVLSADGKRVPDPCTVPGCPVLTQDRDAFLRAAKQQGSAAVLAATRVAMTPLSYGWRIRFLIGVPREMAFVTPSYAAEVLGISRQALYARIRSRTMPARLIESAAGAWMYVIPRDEFLDVVTAPA